MKLRNETPKKWKPFYLIPAFKKRVKEVNREKMLRTFLQPELQTHTALIWYAIFTAIIAAIFIVLISIYLT